MKLLNNLFKDPSVTQASSKSPKAEKASDSLVVGEKTSVEVVVNVETTSEEDMIKAVFESENKEMSKEDLKAAKTFLEEAPGSLPEKLQALKMVLQKDIPLTVKHLSQVNLALNFPLPQVIIDGLTPEPVKEESGESANKTIEVDQANLEGLLELMKGFESKGVKAPVELIEDDHERVTIDPHEGQRETSFEGELETQEPLETLPVEGQESASFLQPLEDLTEVLSEMISEPSKEVLKFVEVKVSQVMVEAKQTFEVVQKNIVNTLDLVTPRTLPVDGKEVLAAVIDKLDDVLMKSDMTLYTDMTTERDLLSSSSKLEKSRGLIKDQPHKAFEIIKEVKNQIDRIRFNPSKEKIFGVVQKQFKAQVDIKQEVSYNLQLSGQVGVSPRSVLETLRSLGINHEAEVAEVLNKNDKTAFKSIENMKSVLMKLDNTHDEKVVKSLDHITGQQLVNKLDVKSQKQHLMFHMPVQTQTEIKDMKIHVNGQKNNQKMDWQNSRLYFVVHLDSIGDTGILVDVHGGQLSMTIKNDSLGLEDKMKTIMSEASQRLEEVGFLAQKIKFAPLSREEKLPHQTAKKEEGFDVTI